MGVGRTWTDGEDGATHTAGREIVLHAGADATAKEAGVVAAGSRVAVEACVALAVPSVAQTHRRCASSESWAVAPVRHGCAAR